MRERMGGTNLLDTNLDLGYNFFTMSKIKNIGEIIEMAFLCLGKNSLLESPRKGQFLSVLVSIDTPDKIYDDIHFEYLSFDAFATCTDYPSNFDNRNYNLWGFQILFEVDSKTNNINRAIISFRYMHGIDLMKIRGFIDSKKFPEDADKTLGLALNEIKEFIVQQY
ncbi:MAG: hypothetical protein WDA29_08340 [Flavobacteriaceae bacterium]